MKLHRAFQSIVIGIVVIITAMPAHAGKECREHRVSVKEFRSALQTAEALKAHLNRSEGTIALLARVGSDISSYGLKYTHIGIAWKSSVGDDWNVVHQLNPCSTDRSVLRVHGLANFMLDDLLRHDVKIIHVRRSLGEQMARILMQRQPVKIHEPKYSMISYPGLPVRYQNSNQWVLEIIAQAQASRVNRILGTREQTHRFYLENGYRGSEIRISPLRRTFAKMWAKNIHFDDHPPQSRASGKFETVTAKSIEAYLRISDDLTSVREIRSDYIRHPLPDVDDQDQEN